MLILFVAAYLKGASDIIGCMEIKFSIQIKQSKSK